MKLRSYVATDCGAVNDLWRIAGIEVDETDVPENLELVSRYNRDLFLVLEDQGQLVATAISTFNGRRGWLYHLAVLPEYQGRGLGRWLVAEAEARLRTLGCCRLNLHVSPNNTKVLGFYQRLGFRKYEAISLSKRLFAAQSETSSPGNRLGAGTF